MAAGKTARVRMLGNYQEYEAGKAYDLPLEKANALTGMGFAVIAADQGSEAPAEKE